MCAGVSARSVEQQAPSSTSSNLAAALLDSHPRPPEPHRSKGCSNLAIQFRDGETLKMSGYFESFYFNADICTFVF